MTFCKLYLSSQFGFFPVLLQESIKLSMSGGTSEPVEASSSTGKMLDLMKFGSIFPIKNEVCLNAFEDALKKKGSFKTKFVNKISIKMLQYLRKIFKST